ncbi:prolactin-like [Ctenodactylus gundi]
MSILTSQLFRELEASYANAPWHFTNEVSPCHTASIATPGKAQAKKMLVSRSPSFPRPKRAATNSTMRLAKETLRKFPELFTLTMRILRSWTGPLSHLVKNFKSPPSIANRAKLLEQESKQLLRDMEKIAGRVTHKAVPKKDFNTWPELTSLLSTDWTARLLAVYNLARCIKADAQRIDSYTKILRCQFKETC